VDVSTRAESQYGQCVLAAHASGRCSSCLAKLELGALDSFAGVIRAARKGLRQDSSPHGGSWPVRTLVTGPIQMAAITRRDGGRETAIKGGCRV